MMPFSRIAGPCRRSPAVSGGLAFALSSAVHAAVLLPLVTMHWASPTPPDEPTRVMEVTLSWQPPPAVAEVPPQPLPPPAVPHPAVPQPAPTHKLPARPAPTAHRSAPAPVPAAVPAPATAKAPAAVPPPAAAEVPAAAPAPPPPAASAAQPAAEGTRPTAAAMAAPSAPAAGPAADPQLASYARRLLAQLERYKSYPMLSQRRGEEGTVTLRITIGADGRVLDAHAADDGPSRLVAASLEAVAAAAPFPPLPSGLGAERMVFNLPMTYRLR